MEEQALMVNRDDVFLRGSPSIILRHCLFNDVSRQEYIDQIHESLSNIRAQRMNLFILLEKFQSFLDNFVRFTTNQSAKKNVRKVFIPRVKEHLKKLVHLKLLQT